LDGLGYNNITDCDDFDWDFSPSYESDNITFPVPSEERFEIDISGQERFYLTDRRLAIVDV
jgi:hypothetical protein